MLRLVPFNPAWIQHDKLDLHAIYRRPQFTEDAYGEQVRKLEDGLPAWDLTGGLPVKHHNKYVSKGFEYVTLADKDSLFAAAKKGALLDETGQPCAAREFVQDAKTGGPWNYRKYAEGQAQVVSAELVQIREAVAKYGSETYEEIRQMSEPGFALPEWLKGFNAGDEVPSGPVEQSKARAVASVAPPTDAEATRRKPSRRRKLAEATQ